ncbi:protein phosphatase 2C domain-containing protein [Streptomyces sp. NPDC005551]|uniref:protein phosphatase 2C domain-containing protein n=1 Tax=Streptomyces sp. NPDC005551 TaxID=3364725 RepID=UPI0036CE1535
MSQQGERPAGHEDDWWGQLYDGATGDTGPAAAADSLDDRFASAAGTVGGGPAPGAAADEVPPRPGETRGVPEQRTGGSGRPSADPGSRGGALHGEREPVTGAPGGTSADVPPRPAAEPAPSATPAGAQPPPDGPPPPDVAPRPPAEDPRAAAGRPLTDGPRAPGRVPPTDGARPPIDSAPPPIDSAPPPVDGVRPPVDGAPPTEGTRPPVEGAPTPTDPPRPQVAAEPGQVPSPPAMPPAMHPDVAPAPVGSASAAGPQAPGHAPPPAGPRPPVGPPSVGVPPPPVGFQPVERAPVPGRPGAPERGVPVPSASFGPVGGQAWPSLADAGPPESVPGAPAGPAPVGHVGSGPPTYEAEPTALPPADPDELADLVADTVLDGAQYGTCTLRAVSVRGDSARYRGEPRRDSLLTARFGTGENALVLVAMATGARTAPGAHRAAAEACRWIGRAVGRSHARLAEDIRAGRRGDLKSGLQRLTDRSLGKLRAAAAEQGVEPEEYTAGLRCLLLPADPDCRTRVFFGVGAGGLFRLRDGEWQDIEPRVTETAGEAVVGFGSPPHETPEGDRLTMDLGIATPPSPYEPAPRPPRAPFRFRASVARPGDTLLLCTSGLAEPLRGEPELAAHLTGRWSTSEPPGLAAFLADSQVRVKGYADDRTAAAVWEA